MNAIIYSIPSRAEDELQRRQDERTQWMLTAAEQIKRWRAEDRELRKRGERK